MPLVDITLKPGYRMKMLGMKDPHTTAHETITHDMVKGRFARALPTLLVEHAQRLGLDPTTPPEGVQVMCHDYALYDVNTANVWIKFQFSEERHPLEERRYITDRLYNLLIEWFREQELEPENFMIDLFWGPTNGMGTVNGREIVW